MKQLVLALLVKQKAAILPRWLEMIENLDYPKSSISLYIRTNNNTDQTPAILRQWIDAVGSSYSEIHFDDSDIDSAIAGYEVHEWNAERFSVLARIREASITWAHERGCDYFVVDCDNYLLPDTIRRLQAWNVPVVAPLLHCVDPEWPTYSNYHSHITEIGYFQNHEDYYKFWSQQIKGCIEMPVVHCTYYIRNEFLDAISYHDGTESHEYVIFSRNLRAREVPQYLDNTRIHGFLTLNERGELAVERLAGLAVR